MISLFKRKGEAKAAMASARMDSVDTAKNIRQDFPVLMNSSQPLIYADNACVTLRPKQVMDAISRYYSELGTCAGRSNHRLSRELDLALNEARTQISRFVGAAHSDEIIFTRNATEGINLIAHALDFAEGDIVLTSHKEHNSNLVPWQELSKRSGVIHKVIPAGSDGSFSTDNLQRELDAAKKDGARVRLVCLPHISNIDGTMIDVALAATRAHWYGALVLVDGCQAVGHTPVNVKELGIDFYAFSAHKMFGPSGMGALYASRAAQTQLGQFIVGGSTVVRTTYSSAEFQSGPSRFEAGLQDYAGILGFAAACKYLDKIGTRDIHNHTLRLNSLLTDLLAAEIDAKSIQLLGPRDPAGRSSIFSFVVPVMPQTEFASLLDKTYGIAVRAGQHCAHSWFHANNLDGSVRISLHAYNTDDEIRQIAQAVRALLRLHGG